MAATAGYTGLVKISTNTVANVKSDTFDVTRMMEDITSMSTSGTPVAAKSFLPTLYEGACTITCNWDLTDTTGQLAMQNAFFAGTLLSFTLSPNNNTNTYAFSAYIKKIGIKDDVSKVNEASYELQISGAITAS